MDCGYNVKLTSCHQLHTLKRFSHLKARCCRCVLGSIKASVSGLSSVKAGGRVSFTTSLRCQPPIATVLGRYIEPAVSSVRGMERRPFFTLGEDSLVTRGDRSKVLDMIISRMKIWPTKQRMLKQAYSTS